MNLNFYWTRHSCETQLTMVINNWAKILDNKGQVVTIILGFKKAFDPLSHELLNKKLFSYGIGGKTWKWIDSFLCFRQQCVVVNGVKKYEYDQKIPQSHNADQPTAPGERVTEHLQ